MADMVSYPSYLLAKIEACLGQRVWEIGVGNGQYTASLLESGRAVLATDIDAECLRLVSHRHAGHPSLRLAEIDLNNPETLSSISAFEPDSVICLNVLEHIVDDERALRSILGCCQPSARLGMIVPAHPSLFGRMDREAGHQRRYTRIGLKSVLERSGWLVERCDYINAFGALGWWVHNRLRHSAGLDDRQVNWQMRTMDRWLPRLAAVTDPVFRQVCGLSVAAIARVRE